MTSAKVDTSSKEWRHLCEVRHVLGLGDMQAMKSYMDRAQEKCGKKAADRLREDVRAAIEQQRAGQ